MSTLSKVLLCITNTCDTAGAGKTYTMSGGRQNYKHRGLIPRILTALFTEAKNRPLQDTRVNISYLEIYNEQLFDLLDITTQPHEINVQDISSSRQGSGSGIKVMGLKTVVVDTEADAMKLLFEVRHLPAHVAAALSALERHGNSPTTAQHGQQWYERLDRLAHRHRLGQQMLV